MKLNVNVPLRLSCNNSGDSHDLTFEHSHQPLLYFVFSTLSFHSEHHYASVEAHRAASMATDFSICGQVKQTLCKVLICEHIFEL